MSGGHRYCPEPRLQELGSNFYDHVQALQFPERVLRFRNGPWSREVGLEHLSDERWLDHFGSFESLPGNLKGPHCMRYHGHQFHNYNPELGDGRGFTFAQIRARDGRLLDLGTKGSGPTPYSRGGDGRLTLKGGVREILATEMLEALGVNTSKTFSIIETGEALQRGDEPSPTRSCVLVRLGHSHLRFGSFQRLAHDGVPVETQKLVDHAVAHYFPELEDALAPEERYAQFFEQVSQKTIELVASWTASGFVHGVLNTDNMNICGESFDYGPWRFLPTYDPNFTAAYFDHNGLYSFSRQADAVGWNLLRLAESLESLISLDRASDWLRKRYYVDFDLALNRRISKRLGLTARADEHVNQKGEGLAALVFRFMRENDVGFERFFFDCYGGIADETRALRGPHAAAYGGPSFLELGRAMQRHERSPEACRRLKDPYFSGDGPQTMLIEEVEEIWSAIEANDDWEPLRRKVADLRSVGVAAG